jgi:hypothetical protein
MSIKIEVTYSKSPQGVVGGDPSVPLNSSFQFFSKDGPMRVQFVGAEHVMLPDNTDFIASKQGDYKFKCFLMVAGKEVVLDPDQGTGGTLKVT